MQMCSTSAKAFPISLSPHILTSLFPCLLFMTKHVYWIDLILNNIMVSVSLFHILDSALLPPNSRSNCKLMAEELDLLISGWAELPEALLGFLSSSDSLLEETLLVLIPLIQLDQPLLPQPGGRGREREEKVGEREEEEDEEKWTKMS